MKKIYTKPELEVVLLDSTDLICTSGPGFMSGYANRDYGNLSPYRSDDEDYWW